MHLRAFQIAAIKRSAADLVVLLGIGVLSYGAWLAWKPMGFIVGGLALLAMGVLFGRSAAVSERRPQ